MSPKYQKVNWADYSAIEVWHMVRIGDGITQFPPNYLNRETLRTLIRELMLNELHMSRSEIADCKLNALMRKYYLGSTHKFFESNFDVLDYCFPEFHYLEWELHKVPDEFWKVEANRVRYLKYVSEQEGLDLSKLEDVKKIDANMIRKYGGARVLKEADSLYEVLRPVIPESIKEWNLKKIGAWNETKAREAMVWLEKELGLTKATITSLTKYDFYDHDLAGLLGKFCSHSPLKAVQILYPDIEKMDH